MELVTGELVVKVLYTEGCPHYDALLPRLQRLVEEAGLRPDLHLVRVDNPEQARRLRFLGSPTVRVNGRDVEPDAAARADVGLGCRLYRGPDGFRGTPTDAELRAALHANGPS
jgi:hypothetical protein